MAANLQQLLSRGQQADGFGAQGLLNAVESEQIVQRLSALPIDQFGSSKFMTQHDWINKLNLQAHFNAQTHSDEFVVEQLVSHDRVSVLVHELLVAEAWKEKLYPLLKKHLAKEVDSVTSYLLLFHETAVANLLEVILFHSHALEAVSEDALVELADWCYRKLRYLNAEAHKDVEPKERTAQEVLNQSPVEELEEKVREVAFGAALCSLTILRYMTDAVTTLPMGLLGRLMGTNDTVMALAPLLENPPWVRRNKGRTEKFIDNKWQTVAPADQLKVTQPDAQVWLALNSLLVEPKCRAKYDLDEYRREALGKLRRHIHEVLLDQLPVLKDLCRVLDELSIGAMPDGEQYKSSRLILEQVPMLRENILKGRNWKAVAQQQKVEQFGAASKAMALDRLESMLQSLQFMCDLEPEPPAAVSSSGRDTVTADPASLPVKVACRRQVKQGVWKDWCDLELRIDGSRPPEPVELEGEGGRKVSGLRYRLAALQLQDTRPLPSSGKVVVRHGDRTAEALLQLPVIPLKSSSEGAALLWLTVGLLATDGFALQLKLKKAEKFMERDNVEGVWFAYHAIGGAITLLKETS